MLFNKLKFRESYYKWFRKIEVGYWN